MAQKKATAKKPTVKIVRKTKRTEAEDRKAAAIEKRKATLAKKAQIEEVENKYSVMAESLPQEWIMGADKVELLKTIHRDILGLTKKGDLRPLNDLRLYFIEAAQRGLNPFKNQIHAVYYYDKSIGAEKLTPITGIDGFIALAQRTKQYAGMSETRYEDFEEGHEYAGYPKKAVVDIYGYNPVTGAREIINTATAWWEEYVPLIDEKMMMASRQARSASTQSGRNVRAVSSRSVLRLSVFVACSQNRQVGCTLCKRLSTCAPPNQKIRPSATTMTRRRKSTSS